MWYTVEWLSFDDTGWLPYPHSDVVNKRLEYLDAVRICAEFKKRKPTELFRVVQVTQTMKVVEDDD